MQTRPVSSQPERPRQLRPRTRVLGRPASLHCALRGGQGHQPACSGRGLGGAGVRLTSWSVALCVESRGDFRGQRLEPRPAGQGPLPLSPSCPCHSQGPEQHWAGGMF